MTATDKSGGIADGETTADGQPASVVCRWLGAQAPHSITATLTLGGGTSERSVSMGAVMVQGQPDDGNITVNAPELPSNYQGDCTYTPIEVNEPTRSVWGEITCASFEPFDGVDSCTTGPGYYFFENCTPL